MEKQENTGLATGALSHLSVELDGDWTKGLSKTTALRIRGEFNSKDEALKAINKNPNIKLNSIGNKGMEDIRLWLGLEPKKKRPVSEHTKLKMALTHQLPRAIDNIKLFTEDECIELLDLLKRINTRI